MSIRVKICGITTPEAAREVCRCGADAIGLVFAESPRRVTLEAALAIVAVVPPFVGRVAVFHHPDPRSVATVVQRLRPDLVQCEPTPELVDALGSRLLAVFHDHAGLQGEIAAYDRRCATFPPVLLEAAGRGGRGRRPDWRTAAELAREQPLVLAGGLTPDNVADAIRFVRPAAVDVSSGVESAPGVKDPQRVARFVSEVRRADLEIHHGRAS